MAKPYSELVAQAERAVAGVKDAELRRVAFERVLNDLLGSADEGPEPKPRRTGRAAKHVPQKAASKKRGGPQGYVEEMVEDGFFKKPKTISEVKAELENRKVRRGQIRSWLFTVDSGKGRFRRRESLFGSAANNPEQKTRLSARSTKSSANSMG